MGLSTQPSNTLVKNPEVNCVKFPNSGSFCSQNLLISSASGGRPPDPLPGLHPKTPGLYPPNKTSWRCHCIPRCLHLFTRVLVFIRRISSTLGLPWRFLLSVCVCRFTRAVSHVTPGWVVIGCYHDRCPPSHCHTITSIGQFINYSPYHFPSPPHCRHVMSYVTSRILLNDIIETDRKRPWILFPVIGGADITWRMTSSSCSNEGNRMRQDVVTWIRFVYKDLTSIWRLFRYSCVGHEQFLTDRLF